MWKNVEKWRVLICSGQSYSWGECGSLHTGSQKRETNWKHKPGHPDLNQTGPPSQSQFNIIIIIIISAWGWILRHIKSLLLRKASAFINRVEVPVRLWLESEKNARWPCSFCICVHSWMCLIYWRWRQLWDIWFVWHKAADHTRPNLGTKKWQGVAVGRILPSLFRQHVLDLQLHVRLCGAKLLLEVLRNSTWNFYELWFRGSGALWTVLGSFLLPDGHFSACNCGNIKKVYLERKNLPAVSARLRNLNSEKI